MTDRADNGPAQSIRAPTSSVVTSTSEVELIGRTPRQPHSHVSRTTTHASNAAWRATTSRYTSASVLIDLPYMATSPEVSAEVM
ncbi:hypothetical protein B296_00055972 [Ensete ventricosum]|uniref:Uncharacterized protein n=1 Tax=Ensete ventricosum TaxID=4639 RepID=A0A426XX67_ENSVE|nr:hypothetical protein B296_00055972 [Ensete ventricosum]